MRGVLHMNKSLKALAGIGIGFINGLLGAGGGMLAVPVLKQSGLEQKKAHATGLALILPLSIFSAVMYTVSGKVTLDNALPFIPAGLIGALAGAWLMPKLPSRILKMMLGVFMVWAAIRLIVS